MQDCPIIRVGGDLQVRFGVDLIERFFIETLIEEAVIPGARDGIQDQACDVRQNGEREQLRDHQIAKGKQVDIDNTKCHTDVNEGDDIKAARNGVGEQVVKCYLDAHISPVKKAFGNPLI